MPIIAKLDEERDGGSLTSCLGPQAEVAAELRRLTSFVGAFECDLDAAIERVENHRDGLA